MNPQEHAGQTGVDHGGQVRQLHGTGQAAGHQQVDAEPVGRGGEAAEAGERGKRLLRRRGELLERPFAHLYDTGGMRRTHLRGTGNILKRLLVHPGAFNLGRVMRRLVGRGTPRGLAAVCGAFFEHLQGLRRLVRALYATMSPLCRSARDYQPLRTVA